MMTISQRYRVMGAYGDGVLSNHRLLRRAIKAQRGLSWYERAAPHPHDAHVVDADGNRVSDDELETAMEDQA